jgi:hypothetical protein
MLVDLDLANLCQAMYDGRDTFDVDQHTSGVDWAIKSYFDCTAIVFEGSHDLPDWVSNIEFEMIQVPDFAGVEKGFYDGLPDVYAAAERYLPKDKTVYVTGHSRGAAHAQIFTAMLIKGGYRTVTVTFGSPRPGDKDLANILIASTNRSYRNFHTFDEQDFVCDVPLCHPFGYVRPGVDLIVDVAPSPDDPWLLLSRHHLGLYIEGVKRYGKSDAGQ